MKNPVQRALYECVEKTFYKRRRLWVDRPQGARIEGSVLRLHIALKLAAKYRLRMKIPTWAPPFIKFFTAPPTNHSLGGARCFLNSFIGSRQNRFLPMCYSRLECYGRL